MYSVAVLAGGLGTRLRAVTGPDLPKALVPVAGTPFIDLKLAELRDRGARHVVMLVGHGAEAIRAHVGDGRRFGVDVTYRADGPEPLGTGGAVRAAVAELGSPFWVTYADTLLDVNVEEAERSFARSGGSALMTVLHNRNAIEASNARVEGARVVAYSKLPPPAGAEHIDYGMLLMRREALDGHGVGESFDLADTLTTLASNGQLGAFQVWEPFHEIGTPEALEATEVHLNPPSDVSEGAGREASRSPGDDGRSSD